MTSIVLTVILGLMNFLLFALPAFASGLSWEIINETVAKYRPQTQHCYQRELNAAKTPFSGRIDVKFKVGKDGKVLESKTTTSSLDNAAVDKCLHDIVKRMIFPAQDGELEATYPFTFAPAEKAAKTKKKQK